MMKRTIHEGSVSYSQTLPNPLPGGGKNFRKPTNSQMKRRKAYIDNLPNKKSAKLHMASAYGKSVSE